MDNIDSMSGYRSVYMAFGAFKVNPSQSQAGAKVAKTGENEDASFMSALNLATNKVDDYEADVVEENEDDLSVQSTKTDLFNNGAFLSYTRIITAHIPDDMTSAIENGDTDSVFSAQNGGQDLQITVKVDGPNRIYTAQGIDKDGNKFSKEIDPYNVDPTDTDYPGFATLCAYLRDTEGMADNAMQAVRDAMPEDMNENGNYILKVGLISQENGNLSGAKKLFEQMQTFFTKLLDLSSASPSDSGQTAMSVRSDNSDSGTGSLSQNKKSQILDELQQMIQLMLQQMLKELMGDDSYEEVSTENDEEEEIAAESVSNNDESKETAAESLTETKEPSVSEEETMEDGLDLENAQVL
ncbi:hypothetical protein [Butyrivibrio sp. FC2001]|uniref:hypothetical protein n=1 Tax=Butyrivibrio sp. FC2001 TaxID=1280671 RepID=UPI00040AA892|nr:hypothetical protein [Butyrivibrio sp. FC2001]